MSVSETFTSWRPIRDINSQVITLLHEIPYAVRPMNGIGVDQLSNF